MSYRTLTLFEIRNDNLQVTVVTHLKNAQKKQMNFIEKILVKVFPTKNQWKKWTLPSKLTALAFYLSVATILISVISYTTIKVQDYLNSVIYVKENNIDVNSIDKAILLKNIEYNGDIKVKYPQIKHILSNKLLDKINEEIKRNATEHLRKYIIDYNFNYKEGIVTPKLLTLKIEQYYYYYGAANGNASIFSINVDPNSQKIIDFFDVFDQRRNALNEIKSIIYKKAKKECASVFNDDLEKSSYIPRFFIKKESIEFIFSEYEITPGACGSFTIDIPYSEIIELIRHDGPLALIVSPAGNWEASEIFRRSIMSTLE